MPASPTRRSVKWAAACLAWPLMLGCTQTASQGPPGPSPVGEDRLTVVCTTTMIADLVRNLAGEVAEVHGIMKEGEDPHVYDVRPRDAELIAGADLVLLNGYHLEATLGHVIDNNAEGEVVPLAERAVAQPLAGGDGLGAPDPHCWMNVAYFRRYADHARDALIQADPAQEAIYRRNTDQYQLALDELEAWIRQEVARVPPSRRVMITSHDAFAYLGDAYQIEVHGMIGISTEQAPRPQDIEKLESLIRHRGVRALFVETSVSETLNRLVRKSAAATGAEIGGKLYSDSLGPAGTPEGTYVGMMRHNVSTIVEALR